MEGLSQCKSDSDNEQGTNKYYYRDPCNQTNAVKVKLFYGAIYSIGCLLFPCVSLEQDCITHKHKKGIAMKIMKYDRFSVLILGQYLIGQKYVIFKTNKITLVRREEPTKNVVGFKNVIDLYNDISNVKTAEQFHWLKFLSWGWKLEIKAQISTIAVFIVVKQQIFFSLLRKEWNSEVNGISLPALGEWYCWYRAVAYFAGPYLFIAPDANRLCSIPLNFT